MRKISLILVLLVSTLTFAQKKHSIVSTQAETVKETKSTPITGYVAVGIGISNGNTYDTNESKYSFTDSSFPSVEVGINVKNVAIGVNVGRTNFHNLGDNTDSIKNYYSELKVVPSFPLGAVSANLIFGAGSYFTGRGTFIEYGTGISYSVGKCSYGLSYSNFDGVDYISLGLSYNFNFK